MDFGLGQVHQLELEERFLSNFHSIFGVRLARASVQIREITMELDQDGCSMRALFRLTLVPPRYTISVPTESFVTMSNPVPPGGAIDHERMTRIECHEPREMVLEQYQYYIPPNYGLTQSCSVDLELIQMMVGQMVRDHDRQIRETLAPVAELQRQIEGIGPTAAEIRCRAERLQARAEQVRVNWNAEIGRLFNSRFTDSVRERQGEVDRRANEFLLSTLSELQKECLNRNNYFLVRGKSGWLYKIHCDSLVSNIEMLDEEREQVATFCLAVKGGLPRGDVFAIQKLLLEADEVKFRAKANGAVGNSKYLSIAKYGVAGLINYLCSSYPPKPFLVRKLNPMSVKLGATQQWFKDYIFRYGV